MSNETRATPKVFVLDVDGVLTDGQFHYTSDGKVMKIFGSDDHDILSILRHYIDIQFITGDHRGFEISKARVETDMKFPIALVSTIKRIDWIKERWDPNSVIYMGDGIFDHYVFKEVAYSVAPANGDKYTKSKADFVTEKSGGDRAVAEAGMHILERYFKPYDPSQLPDDQIVLSGEWGT